MLGTASVANTATRSSCRLLKRNCTRRPLSSQDSPLAQKFNEKLDALNDAQRRFEYEHQKTIGLTTIPLSAPKSVRVHAEAKPWDGEEGAIEVSRRMLEDSYKPLKISRSERLSSARENVLDYTLNKDMGPTHKERFQSSKKPRFSGSGSRSSGLSSGGWIESIAGQEIENAIARGQFDNIPRGVNAIDAKDSLIQSGRNPNLDFTEYLMNNIIKKQGGAPPWIMKQQAVTERIETFRERIRLRLQERLIHALAVEAENDQQKAMNLALRRKHKDEEWEALYKDYHTEAIAAINSQIRGYNLQAPSSARRGYLDYTDELDRCYANVTGGIEKALAAYLGSLQVPAADRDKLHRSLPPLEPSEKHYGIKQLIKDMWFK